MKTVSGMPGAVNSQMQSNALRFHQRPGVLNTNHRPNLSQHTRLRQRPICRTGPARRSSVGSASRSARSVTVAPSFFQFIGQAAVRAAARFVTAGIGGMQRQHRRKSNFGLLRLRSQGILGGLCSSTPRPAMRPNPSFKRTPNSVAAQPASAGPSAHFALAGRATTLSVSA